RQFALIVQEQLKYSSLAASDQFILRDILSGLSLHAINTAEQRFFSQLHGDLTRLALEISDSAQAAFRPNSNKDYFDAAWLQRTAAFRSITLPHFKGAKMSESQSNPCLAAALVNVRKAYRLLWLYQQTLMDTYNQIAQQLNVKHYYGELDPLIRATNP